ncbi:hypothetical protein P7C73_g3276, partial [Tremellales sp. Uapishka_1]
PPCLNIMFRTPPRRPAPIHSSASAAPLSSVERPRSPYRSLPSTPVPRSPFSLFRSSSPAAGSPSSPALVYDVHLDSSRGVSFVRQDPAGSGVFLELQPLDQATAHDGTFTVVCEVANKDLVVLVLLDGKGRRKAELTSTVRGTEIVLPGNPREKGDERVIMAHKEGSSNHRLVTESATYNWTESTGLALCLDCATRKPLAKLQYKLFGRDRLVVQNEGGEVVPLMIITAARMWFDHQSGRDFRLQ